MSQRPKGVIIGGSSNARKEKEKDALSLARKPNKNKGVVSVGTRKEDDSDLPSSKKHRVHLPKSK